MADALEPVDDQSPVQQTLEINRHRIITVIDRMLEKIEITLSLDKLLAYNCELIAEFLTAQELSAIKTLRAKVYKLGSAGISSKSMAQQSQIRSKTSRMRKSMSMEFRHLHQDANCSALLAILHHNPDIMNRVQEIIDRKSPDALQFLYWMQELRDNFMTMLHASAAEDRAYNKKIGEAWRNNEKYKQKNAEMEKIHDNKMYELSFKIKEKHAMIEDYKRQMEETRESCVSDLHKIITDSERYMAKTSIASEENQEFLGDEAKHVTSQYQGLLETHLAHEKALRVKRYKVETVLAGWLAKYDQDIGELQSQLEEQEDGYKKEKDDFEDLTERFKAQTIQYDELMEEKEIEEQRLFDIKRYEFMCLRSARRIQRWWRAILARRRGRRKKGKGKGKKK